MEAAAILALVERGLGIAGALIGAGMSAAPAIEALAKLVAGQREGTLTDEDIAATERLLDSLIADFNEPMA